MLSRHDRHHNRWGLATTSGPQTEGPRHPVGVVLIVLAVSGCSGPEVAPSTLPPAVTVQPTTTGATEAPDPEGNFLDPPTGWAISSDGSRIAAIESDLTANVPRGLRVTVTLATAGSDRTLDLTTLPDLDDRTPIDVVTDPSISSISGLDMATIVLNDPETEITSEVAVGLLDGVGVVILFEAPQQQWDRELLHELVDF